MYEREIHEQFNGMGKNTRQLLLVNQLMEWHLQKCPTSKVMDRKNVFTSFCDTFGKTSVGLVTKKDLTAWLELIQSRNNYTNCNLRNIKTQINHFFRFLVEEDVLAHNPVASIVIKKGPPSRPRVVLAEEEISSLLEMLKTHSPTELYPVFYAELHTGARMSEVVWLKWAQVDFSTGLIHFLRTKNGEDRFIRMSEQLSAFLKALPRHCDYVFTNWNNEMWTKNQYRKLIVKIKSKHAFPKYWNNHVMRHTFAYHYLRKGGNMYQLKAILGHRSIQMTVDLYGKITAQDVDNPSPFTF
jgi:site-specific recombinase XerD